MSDLSAFYAPSAGEALKVVYGTAVNSEITDLYDGYGSAWTSVPSPSYTSITVGNGTLSYYYYDLHGRIHYRFALTFGSTTTIGSLPRAGDGVSHLGNYASGFGAACDVSDSNRWHPIAIDKVSSTARFHVTSTAPFTWTTGDILTGQWSRRITPGVTSRF